MENKTQKKHTSNSTPFYTFARFILRIFFFLVYRSKCVGKEKLDRDAPFIIASTHQSMMDPLLIAHYTKRHEIRFLGKDSLRKNFILRWILDKLHMIPVKRDSTDMKAMRTCINVLKDGHVLGIFPEGTRKETHVLDDMRTGVGIIALRSKAPIIPIYFDRKPTPFKTTTIYVGDEIPYDDILEHGSGKDACNMLMDRIYIHTYELRKQAKSV